MDTNDRPDSVPESLRQEAIRSKGPVRFSRCPNCQTSLQPDWQYCPGCGQESREVIASFSTLVRDFLGDFFTFDSRFFRTIPPFFLKPGLLTRDYLAGHRVRYVGPIRILVFGTIILFALLGRKINQKDWDFSNADGSGAIQVSLNEAEDDDANVGSDSLPQAVNETTDQPSVEAAGNPDGDITASSAVPKDPGGSVPGQAKGPVAGQAVEPVADQTQEPVAGQAVEPVADQTQEPVAGQAQDPVAGQAQEPVQEPVPGQDLEPGQAGALDPTLSLGTNKYDNLNKLLLQIPALSDSLNPEEIADHLVPEKSYWRRKIVVQSAKVYQSDGKNLVTYMIGNGTLIVLTSVFMQSFFLKLLYIRRKKHFIEHFIFTTHTHAAIVYWLIILLVFEIIFNSYSDWLILVIVPYLYLSMLKVYEQGWLKTFVKYSVVTMAYLGIFLPILAVLALGISFLFI